jgi:hypothetical protein
VDLEAHYRKYSEAETEYNQTRTCLRDVDFFVSFVADFSMSKWVTKSVRRIRTVPSAQMMGQPEASPSWDSSPTFQEGLGLKTAFRNPHLLKKRLNQYVNEPQAK